VTVALHEGAWSVVEVGAASHPRPSLPLVVTSKPVTIKLCSFSASSWDTKFTDQLGIDSDFRATLLFCERQPAWREQPRGQSEDHREAN
jgi:hypothetical protein